jgi:glycogen debranching enzyme
MYAEVYRILPKMAAELGLKPSEDHSKMQQALRTAIQKWFWDPQRQAFAYYIDPWKTCAAQEGLGLSFALLFGIADTLQSDQTLKHATTEPAGMPCVYPSFSRYTDAKGQHYGRHSGTVWTHVQGFWAHAAAINGNLDRFDHEFKNLTLHTLHDMQFREIYHPKTGQAYGGMQEDGFKKGWIREWKSTERQTWGATAYLRMVLNGLFGMNFSEQGIGFKPVVPRAYENLRLTGIPYQGAVLNFYIQGSGTRIKQFRVNGQPGPAMIPRDIRGNVVVEMELE